MEGDPDMVFKYCTEKCVYIRNAQLGILRFIFMGAIFLYVVCYEILYACSHLDPHHAMGFGRIDLKTPVDHCKEFDKNCTAKFHNIRDLPYCTQYNGKKPFKPPEDDDIEVNTVVTKVRTCRYFDNRRLEFDVPPPSEIFIPTGYKRVHQKLNKDCYNPEVHKDADLKSKKKYRCPSPWITDKEEDFYIADIEHFKILISHSYSSPLIGKHGVSTGCQGLFAACEANNPKNVKKECKRVKVPGSTGYLAAEDEVGLVNVSDLGIESLKAAESGEDELDVRDLMKITPAAQEYHMKTPMDVKLPHRLGLGDKSLREVGGILLLDVNYDNTGKGRPGIPGLGSADNFGIKHVSYTYRPYFMPSKENLKYEVVQASDHADSRIVDVWHGITIRMQFNGQIVVFSWDRVLKALTTGLTLLALASTLVLNLATLVLPLKEKYNALIYQLSEDYSEFAKIHDPKKPRQADFWTGTMLAQYINPAGMVVGHDKKELEHDGSNGITPKEILKALMMYEVRLNRLDAMDPHMLYEEPAELTKGLGLLYKRTLDEFYEEGQYRGKVKRE